MGSKLKADILRGKSGEIFKIMCTTNKGKKKRANRQLRNSKFYS